MVGAIALIVALSSPAAAAAGWPDIPKVSAGLERKVARSTVSAASGGMSAVRLAGAGEPDGHRVVVVLREAGGGLTERMRGLGARVHSLSRRFGQAALTVPGATVLRRIAGLEGVRTIYPAWGAAPRAGAATSRAPKALRVDGGQSNDGFDVGGGETVGILSDSVARTSAVRDADTQPPPCDSGTLRGSQPQDSGDLPAEVEIRADDAASDSCPQPGGNTDEGAAMAELVHDMVPPAALAFHTVGDFRVTFAQAIDDLCAGANSGGAGATVVVDDILFFAESMYQRGPIAQAAEDCVDSGVSYVSAAGNSADNALRENYTDLDPNANDDSPSTSNDDPGDRASAVDAADLHDFGGTDPGFVEVQLPAGGRVLTVLQWNQPTLSSPANDNKGPQIDMDLLAFDSPAASSGNLIEDSAGNPLSSFDDQAYEQVDSGADPTEIVAIANNGSSSESLYLAADHWAGSRGTIPQSSSTDLEFRLVFFELAGDATIQYVDDTGGDSSMYGHVTGEGVISTAAVPWWDTPEFDTTFGPTNDVDPESFSALGGRLPVHFARDGTFIGDQTVRHPRIAAVDGNNTTFFGRDVNLNAFGEPDNFPNFFGTSAAAPNAAAVAAGMLGTSADRLAPSKVAELLRRNTVDVEGERAAQGSDDVTGSGLINAKAALDEFPTARASGPAEVGPGVEGVELEGINSSAPGSISAYEWRQVDGIDVSLRNADTATANFDAPARPTTLIFELVVTGDSGLTNADRVSVNVEQDLELSGESGKGGGGSVGWVALYLLVAFAAIRCSGSSHQRPSLTYSGPLPRAYERGHQWRLY